MRASKVGSIMIPVAIVAVALFGRLPAARGGAPSSPTYVGSEVCRGCHNGLHSTSQVRTWEQSAHPLAMWSVAEPPEGGRILGNSSASAPFPKDRIAYVLGAGKRAQAYLDKDYRVLPAEWQVQTNTWAPRDAVDAKTQCLGCHVTGFSGADNTWKATGVGCEMCHGPGSVHMFSLDKRGTIVNPARLDPEKRAMVCAQCHSQGRSKDGLHAFPVGFLPGGDLDQCFTYTQHVQPGTRNSQYNEARFGTGAHASRGVGCTTCHDPHAAPGREGRPR
jgi:hypothetical protein